MPLYLDPYLYGFRMMSAEPQGIEPPFITSFTRRRVAPVSEGEHDGSGVEEGSATPDDGEDRSS